MSLRRYRTVDEFIARLFASATVDWMTKRCLSMRSNAKFAFCTLACLHPVSLVGCQVCRIVFANTVHASLALDTMWRHDSWEPMSHRKIAFPFSSIFSFNFTVCSVFEMCLALSYGELRCHEHANGKEPHTLQRAPLLALHQKWRQPKDDFVHFDHEKNYQNEKKKRTNEILVSEAERMRILQMHLALTNSTINTSFTALQMHNAHDNNNSNTPRDVESEHCINFWFATRMLTDRAQSRLVVRFLRFQVLLGRVSREKKNR